MTEEPQTKKGLLWLGCMVPILLIILLPVTAFIVNGLFGPQAAPFDDSDLAYPSEPPMDPASNAFTYICIATNHMYYPEDIFPDPIGQDWNVETGLVVAVSNDVALEWIARALECDRAQFPPLTNWNQLVPELPVMREIARMMAVRSEYLLREGRTDEALRQAVDVVHLGHKVAVAEGSTLHYLVGVVVKAIGLKQIEYIMVNSDLATSDLKPLVKELGEYVDDSAGLESAFKSEYACSRNTINDLVSGRMSGAAIGGEHMEKLLMLGGRMVFDPLETKRMIAERTRLAISNISETVEYAEANGAEPLIPRMGKLGRYGAFLSGNAVGKIICDLTQPAYNRIYGLGARYVAANAALRLVIACRLYEEDHGAMPAKLDDLVPDYIDSVPMDPFDGKPMRYSVSNDTVYTVFKDFIDSGGVFVQGGSGCTNTSDIMTPDMTFLIHPVTNADGNVLFPSR